jgi:hypothetical protein
METDALHPKAAALSDYLARWQRSRWHGSFTISVGPRDVDAIAAEFLEDPRFSALNLLTFFGDPEIALIEQALAALYPFPPALLPIEAAILKQAVMVALSEHGKRRRTDLLVLGGVGAAVVAIAVAARRAA